MLGSSVSPLSKSLLIGVGIRGRKECENEGDTREKQRNSIMEG